MRTIGDIWAVANKRVGKVEQAVLLGLLATAVAVPIAVASPPGAPDLQSTPTLTAVSTTVSASGVTVGIVGGISATGAVTVTISANGQTITISGPSGLEVGPTITVTGLPAGPVTLTGVSAATGRTITATSTVGANGSIAVPASLQGKVLKSLSIVLGARTTVAQAPSSVAQAPSSVAQAPSSVAQAPATAPASTTSQLPTQFPATGAGGMAP